VLNLKSDYQGVDSDSRLENWSHTSTSGNNSIWIPHKNSWKPGNAARAAAQRIIMQGR
jgi:hypothetical protein